MSRRGAVVDSSVLVALVADSGPEGRWAESLVGSDPLVAPHLAPVEAANVLRRLEATGRLGASDAAAAHRDLLALDLALFAYEPFAARVWQLRGGVTAYDAWYVALAEALDLPLATLDRKLARAHGPRCPFLFPG